MTLGDTARVWRRPSLVRRLVVLAAAWILAALLITGGVLTALFQQAALSRFDKSLTDVADGLYAGSTIGDNGEVLAPALTDARALRAYSGKYWQISEPGKNGGLATLVPSRSLFDSELKGPPGGAAALAAKPGKPIYYDTVGPLDQRLRAVAMLSRLPGRSTPVIFIAAEDRGPIDADARRFATTAAIALVLLGGGLIAAVLFQVRVGLQPLFALRREVADVRKGRAERLVRRYPVELEPLAYELNALVAHNQEVVERQRTHVGNLAHALKTPLSVMLAEARSQPGSLADVVARQAEARRDHVDHHLRRARAAARAQGSGERTLVEPVLDELARTLERIFRSDGVTIDWRAPEDLCFQGERQDLLEVAGNVMENACKWSNGRVRVSASAIAPDRLRLVVEDDGPGLPPDRRDEVLKRGTRLDENAPGSGLGLSIVDELARAYGGSIILSDSPLGGLMVKVVLPRAEN